MSKIAIGSEDNVIVAVTDGEKWVSNDESFENELNRDFRPEDIKTKDWLPMPWIRQIAYAVIKKYGTFHILWEVDDKYDEEIPEDAVI